MNIEEEHMKANERLAEAERQDIERLKEIKAKFLTILSEEDWELVCAWGDDIIENKSLLN